MGTRILLTGHNGYLGSVMTPLLVEAGYEVVGLDTGYFAECQLVPDQLSVPAIWKDIRELEPEDLVGFDAVIHLAALSNDPIGNLNPEWTEDINVRGAVRLAKAAKAAGVKRFLFSSSCIMYGMAETEVVTESSPLEPKTDYARSKVKYEQTLSRLADEAFSPTFLRNGTVYGLSPRMRFDTVLNNLMGSAITTGKVVLYGDGKPWRPLIHVEDVARAFRRVLEAPREAIHNQAFNNGENRMNHRTIELAELVMKTVPRCQLEILARPDADQRTYQPDFGKFARTFPDFSFKWTVEDGAKALYESLMALGLTHQDFIDKRFTRLRWLQHLLATERLDHSLRWQTPAGVPQ